MNARTSHLSVPRWVILLVCMLPLGSCQKSSNPAGGTPVDPVATLALTCPGELRVPDVRAPTQAVSFGQPGAAGGIAPVSITCSPGSGATFPIGSTPVVCSASDATTPARRATCSFNVTLVPFVAPVPTLGATRFMAYGDSITAGEINDDSGGSCAPDGGTLGTQVRLPELAYPAIVQAMLSARYTNQTFTVANEGQGLDPASNTARFAAAVRAVRPQAVLFLQGVIDVASDRPPAAIAASIEADINEARAQGVTSFFLSTVLPIRRFSRGCFLTNPDVRATNDAIRALAARTNVYLVDTWAAFVGHERDYLGEENVFGDGLHPTELGQKAIAATFFDVIRSRLEQTSGASASGAALARPGR